MIILLAVSSKSWPDSSAIIADDFNQKMDTQGKNFHEIKEKFEELLSQCDEFNKSDLSLQEFEVFVE